MSATEIVDALLDRIASIEPTVFAWAAIDADRARRSARRIDESIRQDAQLGKLPGVAVGMKDIIHVAGLPTRAGSRALGDEPSQVDAAVASRWRRADGVILGKLHTCEFAGHDPSPSRNAWNPAHTPGGSSSGSAVAVASGMVPCALGSQSGGSTLRPAAYNGIVGMKPSFGLVSCFGMIPFASTLDTVGIFGRSVADVAIGLDALAGVDQRDPHSRRRRRRAPGAAPTPSTPPLVGAVSECFVEHANADVRADFTEALRRVAGAGAEVVLAPLPDVFDRLREDQHVIGPFELAAYHRDRFAERPERYGPQISERIETGLRISAARYAETMQRRAGILAAMERWLAGYDVVVTPSTPTQAPAGLSNTGDARFQVPWSFCGVPAISIPSGLSSDGLPLGLQLIAGRWHDDRLLRAAAWCESVLGFTHRPPSWDPA